MQADVARFENKLKSLNEKYNDLWTDKIESKKEVDKFKEVGHTLYLVSMDLSDGMPLMSTIALPVPNFLKFQKFEDKLILSTEEGLLLLKKGDLTSIRVHDAPTNLFVNLVLVKKLADGAQLCMCEWALPL